MTTLADTRRPLANIPGTVVLLGAGKMGGAMLDGWFRLGLDPKQVVVIEPQPTREVAAAAAHGLRLNPTINDIQGVTVVFVAVKPQIASQAVPGLAAILGPETVVISIMAGRTLDFLATALPNAAIVRAMPNTPAAIGRGITVAVGNRRVTAAARDLTQNLLSATGTVEWIDDEALMDAVTAVSGSGPAYVFLLAEALAKAGVAAGLPEGLAERLARQTVAGSGELLYRSPLPAATLRTNVTSPGGTTAAALDVLMGENGLDPLMAEAVAAAAKRGRELGG